MADILYIAGYYASGIPGSETRTAKVWTFRPGDSSPTDISDGLAGDEICCLEFDSTNSILYAGSTNGKIYKYTGGSWSEEYDTGDSARTILSIKKLGSFWYALQSERPGIDSTSGNLYVWKQASAGSWSVVHSTSSPYSVLSPARASSLEVCTGILDVREKNKRALHQRLEEKVCTIRQIGYAACTKSNSDSSWQAGWPLLLRYQRRHLCRRGEHIHLSAPGS